MSRSGEKAACGRCQHLLTHPRQLELELPGFASLSSGYGSTRGQTAYCRFHDVFLVPGDGCSGFKSHES